MKHQLKAPVLSGVDFKAAGHGVQLLNEQHLKDSPVTGERQPSGSVRDPAGSPQIRGESRAGLLEGPIQS